jgi:hypothetical protein
LRPVTGAMRRRFAGGLRGGITANAIRAYTMVPGL